VSATRRDATSFRFRSRLRVAVRLVALRQPDTARTEEPDHDYELMGDADFHELTGAIARLLGR
jgi:hypothetical protein